MSKIKSQLTSLRSGKTKTIKGVKVFRRDDKYIIDGCDYSLEDAIAHVEENSSSKSGGMNYDGLGFIVREPYTEKTVSTHRIRDKKEHAELIADAKKRGLYVWYGSIIRRDGRVFLQQPLLIDWDSVPDKVPDTKKSDGPVLDGFKCPFCSKRLNSAFGRTNHVKAKHEDRLEEYHKLVAGGEDKDDDNDETTDNEVETNELKCPHCDKVAGTKSGLTNHLKAKHPDKL